MSVSRREAAQANQRAAAFVRLQLLGDHEAMHFLLGDLTDELDRLAFVTALASVAGTLGVRTMGRENTLEYLRLMAENSAALSATDEWPDSA